MRFLIYTITVFTLLSCSKTTDKNSSATNDTLQTATKDSVSSGDSADYSKLESYTAPEQTDTALYYTIDHDCAVIISPTDKQIDEMIKANGEDNFATIADDFSYYQSEAMQKLDSVGVKTTSSEKQYLKFAGDKGAWTLDVRKQDLPAWNIIFFKKNKTPEIISAIDLTAEHVKDYFEIKK
ncbi:MAG TPA: hypothetical protein VIM65_20115 [Cyclobacteriaceae bacterium]